jgi:hypothetical protein
MHRGVVAMSSAKGADEAQEGWVDAATYGLRYAAERQGVNLHTYDASTLARNAVHHALSSGYVVTREDANKRVEDERRKADTHLRRACAAEVAADQQRSRLIAALATWPDREAAEELAHTCGLLLPPAKDEETA